MLFSETLILVTNWKFNCISYGNSIITASLFLNEKFYSFNIECWKYFPLMYDSHQKCVNEKYYFIDEISITVYAWLKRLVFSHVHECIMRIANVAQKLSILPNRHIQIFNFGRIVPNKFKPLHICTVKKKVIDISILI